MKITREYSDGSTNKATKAEITCNVCEKGIWIYDTDCILKHHPTLYPHRCSYCGQGDCFDYEIKIVYKRRKKTFKHY